MYNVQRVKSAWSWPRNPTTNSDAIYVFGTGETKHFRLIVEGTIASQSRVTYQHIDS